MMPRRELRIRATEETIGAVELGADGSVVFERSAQRTFATLRSRLGDEAVARELVDAGWSNGYLYLGPVQP